MLHKTKLKTELDVSLIYHGFNAMDPTKTKHMIIPKYYVTSKISAWNYVKNEFTIKAELFDKINYFDYVLCK